MFGNGKPSINLQFITTCAPIKLKKFLPTFPCDVGYSVTVIPSSMTGTVSVINITKL